MEYNNRPMNVDEFVANLNSGKISLAPPFQRGQVWSRPMRQKLVANVILGRPIPAVFLYKEASGSTVKYNILDGKQRLESLILFIGRNHHSLRINNPEGFFSDRKHREDLHFDIVLPGQRRKLTLAELPDNLVRSLREYRIPIIEITLDENNPASLEEVISLFVDINSTGVAVKRLDIVKAICKGKDKLLTDIFDMVGMEFRRGQDVQYKAKVNDVTIVLKKLQSVEMLDDVRSKVDRMWELLVELALFVRYQEHRSPVSILNSFIKSGRRGDVGENRLSSYERNSIIYLFSFLRMALNNTDIAESRLATSQIHFYTMVTTIISNNYYDKISDEVLIEKLARFAEILNGRGKVRKEIKTLVEKYIDESERQSTHTGRRKTRVELFAQILSDL